MKKQIILFPFLLLTLFSNIAFSEQIMAGGQHPKSVHVFPNHGMFVFYATVNKGELPQCSGDHRWSIKTNKPGAKELISMVISAKISNRTITVVGTGKCNPDGMGYEIAHLYLN